MSNSVSKIDYEQRGTQMLMEFVEILIMHFRAFTLNTSLT